MRCMLMYYSNINTLCFVLTGRPWTAGLDYAVSPLLPITPLYLPTGYLFVPSICHPGTFTAVHSPAPLPGTSNTLLPLGYSPGAFSTVSIYSSYFFLLEELSSTKSILTSATIRIRLISPLLSFSSHTQENIFVYC